ncbi:sugar ABC transporter ATP-binding protein [Trueperella pyogenes]|uniref:Sugar ABC transporter ATP-binding protein n=1 Tax=Trueperella pyogenes TaxID=1661 RepID=A0A3Q9GGP6_9ACTO|nr:sugar ABC transporter ATP-binding protein [Trueperella pyogenes]AZR07400.1 sugar ABC transporter ATP-binding protein [Trueperella pyogenes]MCI7690650.1 sugar ABC transporter ATP-binding protein [Trueperella pyogenes]
MEEYVLEMNSITKEFSGVKALDNVNLKVRRGEVHAICGENGAGKSTLMNVLSGVYPHGTYSGQIVFKGKECQFSGIPDSETAGIAIIHQELALSPYLSVVENIFLGNEKTKRGLVDWEETRARGQIYCAKVGLAVNPMTPVVELGVGQQQLVEIAKAISKDVSLLILDEPTAALNDDDSAHLLELMRQLRDEGVTMIIISHKLNEIAEIADSTTVIRDGQTITTLDMHRSEEVSEEEIIRHMVGRELSSRYPDHESNVGEPILEIKDWTVHHPIDVQRKVVDSANLVLRKGEITGLAGLMGAGRTELAMSVFGKQYGSNISGTVLKNGIAINVSTVPDAIESGLAYVPEDRKSLGLNLIQSIKTNMTAAALGKIVRKGIVRHSIENEVAKTYKKRLSLKAASLENPVSSLSGGNQQKVVLAKWMYTDPQILILDEPTRGIDVGAKYEIYEIVNELADAGHAILMISSELPELLGVCDRIYTMSHGSITGVVPAKEATQESLMTLMTA